MTTIMPDDELMRKAVRYIDALLQEGQEPLGKVLEQAAVRFNLGPAACEYLASLFAGRQNNNTQS